MAFLFSPDFSQVTSSSVLIALGTSFFTLSLGMGAMITYGSYLSDDVSISKSAVQIAAIDTVIAFMAGLMIFPIVFSNGLEPSAGPGLIFQTLPVLFATMPGGQFFSIAFFALLIFAAVTSAISLLEVVVSFVVDEYGIKRIKATVIFGIFIWLVGILSCISTLKIGGSPCLDFFDGIVTHYLMPIGGLCTILVFGWMVSKVDKESEFGKSGYFKAFDFIVKYVSPVLLIFLVLDEIGVF